jgi:hypothetical protein
VHLICVQQIGTTSDLLTLCSSDNVKMKSIQMLPCGQHGCFLLRQVSLLALQSPSGPLDPVDAQLQTLLKEGAGKLTAKEAAPIVRSVIQALRLYACVFRSSVRRCAAVARLSHSYGASAMPTCWRQRWSYCTRHCCVVYVHL